MTEVRTLPVSTITDIARRLYQDSRGRSYWQLELIMGSVTDSLLCEDTTSAEVAFAAEAHRFFADPSAAVLGTSCGQPYNPWSHLRLALTALLPLLVGCLISPALRIRADGPRGKLTIECRYLGRLVRRTRVFDRETVWDVTTIRVGTLRRRYRVTLVMSDGAQQPLGHWAQLYKWQTPGLEARIREVLVATR